MKWEITTTTAVLCEVCRDGYFGGVGSLWPGLSTCARIPHFDIFNDMRMRCFLEDLQLGSFINILYAPSCAPFQGVDIRDHDYNRSTAHA